MALSHWHIFLAEGAGNERSNFLNAHAGFASRMARYVGRPSYPLFLPLLRCEGTDVTTSIGRVSYRPHDLKLGSRHQAFEAVIYVTGLLTYRDAPDEGFRYCDVYIYSNPLRHGYSLLSIREVQHAFSSVDIVELDAANSDDLSTDLKSPTDIYYLKFRERSKRFFLHCVERKAHCAQISGRWMSSPRYLTREVWDLVSIFYDKLAQSIGSVPSDPSRATYDTPLCFATTDTTGVEFVVRFLEMPSKRVHDGCVRGRMRSNF